MKIEILALAHMFFMFFSMALLINAFVIARQKRDSSWLKMHRAIAIAGVVSVVLGFIAMIVNKIIKSYPHFASLHAIGGLAAIIFAATALALGVLILTGKKLRPAHKFFGRAGIIIIIITAVLGALMLVVS
ncbi:MAG: hypothetical protein MUC95_02720 [Spirochaetes bacterium]|nr:hypothetical protein [Spirochaetota bacterium]